MLSFNREKYSEEIKQFNKIINEYRNIPGGLMPILQNAQEIFGYLPKEILADISKELKIPLSRVYGVATFYSQFTFAPKGKNQISVCLGTACYVKGAQQIVEELENELGIKAGETTHDMLFSIIETRCVGDCAIAPIVTVNGKNIGRFTVDKVKPLIEELREESEIDG